MWRYLFLGFILLLTLTACQSSTVKNQEVDKPYHEQIVDLLLGDDSVVPKKLDVHPVTAMYNREAVIPAMCYTRTESVNNPCYVCHQNSISGRENVMNDGGLQEAYSFSDAGLKNHWSNLFIDRSKDVAAISDAEIDAWIKQDNYSELEGRLEAADFKGWKPDLKNLHLGAGAFDKEGFARDGSLWVSYNYKPLPSTFWPTNGSTDDVMIRLGQRFRLDKDEKFSMDIYKANLAILEANFKGLEKITSWPIDENKVGVDLNQDNKLSVVDEIKKLDSYVGLAADEYLDTHLYPANTEFLHTVRYVGIDNEGNVYNSARMKEVRYMKKWKVYAKPVLARHYLLESYEKEAGNLPGYRNIGDYGLDNGSGWSIHGFIENKSGRLRAATHEENFFCMGCHNSVGATIDKTFSFARKVDGKEGWGYINLKGMPDAPNMGEDLGEIATYLKRAGGGGEFRSNAEMQARWFDQSGQLDLAKLAKARDVHDLIVPSPERARELNKAYKVIVDQQTFVYGRDATVTPPKNVYKEVDNKTSPTLEQDKIYSWDIRLDWTKANKLSAKK